MFSPPHHLLLPIRRQNSLTHHAVVLLFAKVLRSLSPYNSNCTQEQESTGTSSSSKPRLKAAALKRLALLLTGRLPGVHDWLVSPEWQEHFPQGYSVLKGTKYWFLSNPFTQTENFSRSENVYISIALAPGYKSNQSHLLPLQRNFPYFLLDAT